MLGLDAAGVDIPKSYLTKSTAQTDGVALFEDNFPVGLILLQSNI